MSIPIRRFEEYDQNGSSTKNRVHGTALEKAVEGVSTSVGKCWTEAVTSDVFHLVLVWEWGNRTLRILLRELFVEKDKVGESTTGLYERLLE